MMIVLRLKVKQGRFCGKKKRLFLFFRFFFFRIESELLRGRSELLEKGSVARK